MHASVHQCFTINWRDHDTQIPSAAYISLDGCQVSGRFLWGTGDASRSGVRSGPSSERPFTFAEIGDGSECACCTRHVTKLLRLTHAFFVSSQ